MQVGDVDILIAEVLQTAHYTTDRQRFPVPLRPSLKEQGVATRAGRSTENFVQYVVQRTGHL